MLKPIFAFCVAEGFAHTGNKAKYLLRMGIFALLSEIPFDLAFYGKIYFGHQNIMCTFFIAILCLMCFDKIGKSKKAASYLLGGLILLAFSILAVAVLFQLFTRGVGIYIYSILSFIPRMLYNGKRGRGLKWFFYVFYPGHLLVLYLLMVL